MQKLFISFITYFALSIGSAHATIITMADVGSLDLVKGGDTLPNSGDATEINWAKGILPDATLTQNTKYDSGGSDWTLVDGTTDVFTVMLTTMPDYFLLKFGIGGVPDTVKSHYLFENKDKLDYAVIDFSEMGIPVLRNFGIDRISHIAEYDSTLITTQVPAPPTLILFGLSLLLLGIGSRFKVKSN